MPCVFREFPYDPTECTFVGKPIDFLVFVGSNKKTVEEVVFVEVKTGKSQLNSHERTLKNAIDAGRVRYETIRLK